MDIIEKICCTCKECKPLADFHKDAHIKDGHARRCKMCMSSRSSRRTSAPFKGTVVCIVCKQEKPDTEFYLDRRSKSGLASRCKQCTYEYRNAWPSRNPKQYRDYIAKYSKLPKEKARIKAYYNAYKPLRQTRWAALKQRVFTHYSKGNICCACCGDTHIEFLSIDHIHGNGTQHRREIKVALYTWLESNGYPDGFRVLCMNCNCSFGRYGYCPHEVARVELEAS